MTPRIIIVLALIVTLPLVACDKSNVKPDVYTSTSDPDITPVDATCFPKGNPFEPKITFYWMESCPACPPAQGAWNEFLNTIPDDDLPVVLESIQIDDPAQDACPTPYGVPAYRISMCGVKIATIFGGKPVESLHEIRKSAFQAWKYANAEHNIRNCDELVKTLQEQSMGE